ncbi:MAG TPA: hypothetical protein DEB30_00640 [Candidatus Peribacter riflensis]|uniref:Uncharacterized protein n=1 Tax=Candidatus Peribacter riflensis TaxID=1735162 RepID=A0A0S1SJX9_9BACT|nr:MAG: hypothetical protein PeribacterA2_0296 [Candidatus Peribacter riflensis]OGJ78264.1 MAG: hypothetical protein A2398_05240 [Candidatus Peribacteria bacterium RIFOXYB1_FULL_57_12]OGJ83119.1 MAG: hypothetical protein A2412_01445 [Candidatus Peribacteria bacterium RIFOXYC1_FULL_58_8]ALM10790.1 MAG: hypothetical protein PeribacterB2_0296 [Candidatus Peribacter riflensis]ALM11892.1 MAG: hypothetical protein PeribacterC2_0295 [Candidatus Peribacter riflensis]
MSNRIFTIGLPITLLFLGTMTSSALAQTNTAVQPEDGFLEQPKAIFMDAPAIPSPLYPTLMQEVRAANLQMHLIDTLEIGSPEYKNAHRLLVSNLRMLERQLFFNPVDLARFNSSTHPARSTMDQTIYSPDFPKITVNTSAATFIDAATVAFASNGYSRSYVGSAPTRRSIIVAVEERNALNLLRAL